MGSSSTWGYAHQISTQIVWESFLPMPNVNACHVDTGEHCINAYELVPGNETPIMA